MKSKDRETIYREKRFHILTEIGNPPIGSDIYAKIIERKRKQTGAIISIGDVRSNILE